MQTIKLKPFIIGLLVLIGISFQTVEAKAIYSPNIARGVSIIKQHVEESQAQHGDGSILTAIENIKAYDKAKREEVDETGIYGEAGIAQQMIADTNFNFLRDAPLDGILMAFNIEGSTFTHISNCLRDDIWALESLRDLVAQEMIKAYLNRDAYHGGMLKNDYVYLNDQIRLLRKYGADPLALVPAKIPAGEENEGDFSKITSHEYFFGDMPIGSGGEGDPALNYYSTAGVFSSSDATGCPDGEFEAVAQEIKNATQTFLTLGSGQNVEWGNIWQMAKANARIRARQWIQANQITLTLGGENGARHDSLVKGGGWDRFVGSMKTQLQILKGMVGLVTPLWDSSKFSAKRSAGYVEQAGKCVFYDTETDIFRNCSEDQYEQWQRCEDDLEAAKAEGIRCDRFRNTEEAITYGEKAARQVALQEENKQAKEDVELAFTYYVGLESVAEQTIYDMDGILWDMNMIIKSGYEGVDQGTGEGIPSLVREMKAFSERQCSNK